MPSRLAHSAFNILQFFLFCEFKVSKGLVPYVVHKLELLWTEVCFDREKLVGFLVSKQDRRAFKPKIASKFCFHNVDKVQVRSLRADQRREPYCFQVIFHDLLSLCLSQ